MAGRGGGEPTVKTSWLNWLARQKPHLRDTALALLSIAVLLVLGFINRNLEHVLACMTGLDPGGGGGIKMSEPIVVLPEPITILTSYDSVTESNCSSSKFPLPGGDVLSADVCRRQAHPVVDLFLNGKTLRGFAGDDAKLFVDWLLRCALPRPRKKGACTLESSQLCPNFTSIFPITGDYICLSLSSTGLSVPNLLALKHLTLSPVPEAFPVFLHKAMDALKLT